MPHADPEKRKAYAAEYRAKNREKARETSRLWRIENPDANKEWFERHPEYRQRWSTEHPEQARAAVAKYRAANLEKVRERERTSKAARYARDPDFRLRVCISGTLYRARKQLEMHELQLEEMCG